jgi:ribonuclease VapC
MPNAKVYVFDACALLRLAQDEPGAERVVQLMTEARVGHCQLLMHIINLGEVIYRVAKTYGDEVAQRKRAEITRLPLIIEPFDEPTFWDAVYLKSHYPMSYADCFAAALARRKKATLLTSDPEFAVLGDTLPREVI